MTDVFSETWTPERAPFEASRAAGLARLDAFAPKAAAYGFSRGLDLGPGDRSNVSTLSPYLRRRMVTEQEVLRSVLSRHEAPAAERFISEVFWRTYFKGHLETRPAIWTRYRAELDALLKRLETDAALAESLSRAVEGRTGIDAFDAWAGEIRTIGYLHNHARMWFASIWIFTLKLPWQLGADFTLRHFVDGDPASNTLSWRWVAGLHTEGKTYLARADNIERYTEGRFSPKNLASEAPSLIEEPFGPAAEPPIASPLPAGRAALLLTEEDLHPESLNLSGIEIAAIGAAHAEAGRSPLPVSGLATRFTEAALADALERAGARFGVGAARLTGLEPSALADFAQSNGVDRIVVAHAPVGPAATALAAARSGLAARGIVLETALRPFDGAAWPHATRGFYRFRKAIPELTEAACAG
jgi:deoxyribodipyrimidine photo-lyase